MIVLHGRMTLSMPDCVGRYTRFKHGNGTARRKPPASPVAIVAAKGFAVPSCFRRCSLSEQYSCRRNRGGGPARPFAGPGNASGQGRRALRTGTWSRSDGASRVRFGSRLPLRRGDARRRGFAQRYEARAASAPSAVLAERCADAALPPAASLRSRLNLHGRSSSWTAIPAPRITNARRFAPLALI